MNHVLAAVDFSGASEAVLREAETYARALGAPLTLLHVATPNPEEFVGYEAGPPSVIEERVDRLSDERAKLQQCADDIRTRGVDVDTLLIQGPTAETILQQADRLESQLIVLGSHGHGMLYHALVGSVSAAVVKASDRPVLVVPDPRPTRKAQR